MDISLAAAPVHADGRALVVAELRDSSLSVDECLAMVSLPGAGGTALFVGTVRDQDGGRPVVELEYVAHPLAEREMAAVARQVADDAAQPVLAVAVVHRTGLLAIGDIAVVAAASAAHRAEAFDACRRLIDEVKSQVPIWKRQLFADGTAEWVGACSAGHLP
ncbi:MULTISPECIES: molybdenum cofactor biosynthesis protein MoaE [unclassified Pseudofrankia]|uniref:molybdenum cofactor biosynthesis protein MoaE n=1 Tax=unclassified Pseudofrankia TaxID=2994372 RepID=UPI0008DAAC2F|nr:MULTISPECIES: molybdenum cofactor biosynthesis protein MoaE [unclassified Pseudofrankia]MDT3441173.1 molybdenum cofactor biosynthesis protein MoaE [Pseudofrankia sp. BMG5.37]OHV54236.1 molybdopterin synthase [Pseudofrankia sp. BMG5.36]